jgi:hypothetical protein
MLNETPLARRKHLPEMCLMALNRGLKAVNGLPVTDSQRRYATRNGDLIAPYLVRGWLIATASPIRIVHARTKATLSLFPTPPRREKPEDSTPTACGPSEVSGEIEALHLEALPRVVAMSKRWNRAPRPEKPKRSGLGKSRISYRIRMRYAQQMDEIATPTSPVVESPEIERLRQRQRRLK